jgi:hypothetical protein
MTRTEVLPKSRALTVIEHAASKRREVLLARMKPLQDELKQLDAILATGTPATEPASPTLFPEAE